MDKEKEKLLDDDYRIGKSKKNNYRKLKLIMIILGCLNILLVVVIILLSIFLHKSNEKPIGKCLFRTSNFSTEDIYIHSAIASDAIPCSSVANNIMAVQGGNAIDGAIAGLLCTCSVNFHSCGIGGGSLLLFYNKTQRKTYAFDIREMAPGMATENMFVNNPNASRIGGKSIAVMGLVSGYYEIHKKFGLLEWIKLFKPTINLLKTGYYVTKSMEQGILYFFELKNFSEYTELRNILTDPITGKPKKMGDLIRNPKLAKTLTTLSNEPYAMKNGSLVDNIIEEIKQEGGIITKKDLNDYQTKVREPIELNINGDTIYALPPPSSGVLIAFSLNVLSNYNFQSNFLDTCESSGLFFHRFIETMKFAYAKRSALGDMDFVNNSKLLANLTSTSYAKYIKSLITDDTTHPINYYQPSFDVKEDHGTSHFGLVSADGDAVSVTSTINYLFGSLIMGNNTGIIYNDEMDDFSSPNQTNIYNLPPSPSNFIKPLKRPMSSMSPIIITDKSGNVKLVLGSSGGSKIISSTALIATLTELLGKDMKYSIDIPRLHHQLIPDVAEVENNFPDEIIRLLEKRNHIVVKTDNHAICQGIKKRSDFKFWECNADYRKMGLCDGF